MYRCSGLKSYSYFGIIGALSGAPFDVSFISFDDILADKDLLKNFDVVINVGDADTAQSGGEYWANETVITAVKEFVYNGGGFIGVGAGQILPAGRRAGSGRGTRLQLKYR